MLKPLKPSDTFNVDFVATDIENAETGEVLAIGTSWRHGGANGSLQHTVWDSWAEWWEWICEQAKNDQKFRTVYAHNGGGWDWVGFMEWFLSLPKSGKIHVEIVTANSKIVLLDVQFLRTHWRNPDEKPEVDYTIRLCDSLYLLRSRLGDLAEKLLGKEWGKTEVTIIEVWNAWKNDKPRFYRYLRRDCDSLLMVLERSLFLLRDNVAQIESLGVTIGSTAMKVFRSMMPEDSRITIPMMKSEKDFLRSGYRGGRVEVFNYGYHKRVWVYDINSLYPTAMVNTHVPITGESSITGLFRTKIPGCYRVRFRQTNRSVPPILLVDGNGAYEGIGVYFTPELIAFQSVGEFQVMEGRVFHTADFIFKKYVDRLYHLRLNDPNGPISLLAKYLLNSLYGKFGQHSKREKLVLYSSWDEVVAAEREALKKGLKLTPYKPDSLLYRVECESRVAFEHVGIAGMITSASRAMLWKYLAESAGHLVYCDTDSIHVTAPILDKYIGKELGQLKLEFSGEGVYCGRKLYALRNGAKEKIRCKGVSVKSATQNDGAKLTFDDMVSICKGAEIECRFSQPATIVQVIHGKERSCVLGKQNRKRKIRKT